MLKSIVCGAFAAGVLCVAALAASHAPKSDPMLSGSYLYSGAENCASAEGTLHQISGTISFDPATGKAKTKAFAVTGDKPEILGITSTSTFTNGDGSLTIGANTYHIAYGPVQNGIATSATFIGLVLDGQVTCGFQGTLALQ